MAGSSASLSPGRGGLPAPARPSGRNTRSSAMVRACTGLTSTRTSAPQGCLPALQRARQSSGASTREAPSHPRDAPGGDRLGHAPLLIHADGEHQFLKSLTLELADLLDERVGHADQAGGADEAGVDQLGFAGVQIGVVELVGAEVPM